MDKFSWLRALTLCVAGLLGLQVAFAQDEKPAEPPLTGAAKLQAEAQAVGGLVQSELAMQFLDAANAIEDIEPRKLFVDPQSRTFYTPEEAEELGEEQRAALREMNITTDRYLGGFYGTPIAYARAIDLIGSCGVPPGIMDFSGKRILDFGHGGIGQLRMLASCGADVVGVDVDTFQPALYREPGDQGIVPGHAGGPDGKLTLVNGRWPAEEKAREQVGGGYDLIISKNTLKRGYIHPEREADPRTLIDLGVDDQEFIKALLAALKPGGLLIIYNLSPAPSKAEEPYKPWADGRSPFGRAVMQNAGFRIVTFEMDDSGLARDMGRALGWDAQGMDLQNDLFALVTIMWKPMDFPEDFRIGK